MDASRMRLRICIFAIIALLILIRYKTVATDDPVMHQYENKSVTLCGQLIDEPTRKERGTSVPVSPYAIFVGHVPPGIAIDEPEINKSKITESKTGDNFFEKMNAGANNATRDAYTSNVLIKTGSVNNEIQYGQTLCFEGKISKPKVIINQNGSEFNYPNYLAKDNIFYVLEQGVLLSSQMGPTSRVIQELKNENQNFINQSIVFLTGALFYAKQKLISQIESVLPAPDSLLASGLIISGKGSMSKELQTEFQRVGLIHIVVLSGANVSIIGEAIVRMLSFLPLVWSSIFGGLGILCFSLMVGTSATVVRSTFMSIIALIARISGRTNSALISLCVAGSVMLLWNPLLLTSDPSFQLSFAASLGLILHAPRVKDKILWLIQVWLRIFYKKLSDAERQTKFIFIITRFGVLATLEIVASSLGTQIMTAPLILHMSGMFSIVALPINILLLPLVPLTMFSVFVSGVLSFISSVATLIPQIVSWILLEIILRTVHFASNLPFAVIQFNPLSTRFILFLYVCIMFEYLYYLVKRKQISP